MSRLDLFSFRQLIDRAVVPVRRHLRQMFLPVALPVVLTSVPLAVLQVRVSQGILHPDPAKIDEFLFLTLGLLGLSFVAMAIYLLAFGALMVAALDVLAGRGVDMRRAWLFVLRPRVLATLFLFTVAQVLSFLMFFFPALWMVPLSAFALPVMVEEKITGFEVFRRSAELLHANPGGVFLKSPWVQMLVLLMLGAMLNVVFSTAASLPFSLGQQIATLRQALEGGAALQATPSLWLQVPAVVLANLAVTVSWCYFAFAVALLYREGRRRREAPDLETAIDELVAS